MNKIYFLSDTHFGHQKEFLYGPRGFSSSLENDETIIKNWNSIIDDEDDVYLLGDVMLGDTEYGMTCLKRLKGKIHIVLGNHDTATREELYKTCENVVEIARAIELKYKKYYFWLCHYPTITANYDDDKPWAKHLICIFGHTHQGVKFYSGNPYMYCVCADAQNCMPVEIDTVLEEIKAKKELLDKDIKFY